MMCKKELSVFHNVSTSFIHSASIYYYMIDTVPHVKNITGGDFQRSSEFPPLAGFWMLFYLESIPCVFSTADDLFFFLTVFLKTVIYSFYLLTFPLLFFDDENKRTCQVGHKNGMKCISKSLIILCILL